MRAKQLCLNRQIRGNSVRPRCPVVDTWRGRAKGFSSGIHAIHGAMLGLLITMGGLASSAQDATIPIRQLETDAQLTAKLVASDNESAVSHSHELPSESSSSSAGFVLVAPQNRFPRTANTRFFVLNGLHLGMALFDVAMTQHCLADHHCVEGNPLMPSSVGGQLGVNFAIVGFGTLASYRMKKDDNKLWILSPTVGIIAHTLGVATGFAHR